MIDNVDLFADVAAGLFASLYLSFPIPVDVEVDLLGDQTLGESDPFGATRDTFVEATLAWLGNANIIVFEPGQLGARTIERVALTARGFLALQSTLPGAGGSTVGRSLVLGPAADLRRSLVSAALSGAAPP